MTAIKALGYFALGLITDLFIVIYYRAISGRLVLLAMLMSFLVTLVPLFVAERGIRLQDRRLFLWYAIGAAMGTGIGLMIRL